jgi:transposase
MARYVNYNADQAMLLPPSVRDELGESHLAVFVHEMVERLDLRKFEQEHSDAGRPGFPPQLLLKVWLYAYALGVTSSRRIEQRIHEDLGFRFLAGGWKPDHWTLNEFRRRHPKALNDVFTQVLEAARRLGMARLGSVAIDSTKVKANASADRSSSGQDLRRERARLRQRIRRWQKQCDRDGSEPAGGEAAAPAEWQQRLQQIPRQLEQLRKSGQKRSSRTDPESRYLRQRGGFCLGYTAELAVSGDHMIVGQRVHQQQLDHAGLEAMTETVERECGAPPDTVLADCGYYTMPALVALQRRGIEVLVPDSWAAREINGSIEPVTMNARQQHRHPGLQPLRERMRDPAVRARYARRKALVEPVFGVLQQQRNLRQFRCRGLQAVSTEWSLATTAFNLTRLFRSAHGL